MLEHVRFGVEGLFAEFSLSESGEEVEHVGADCSLSGTGAGGHEDVAIAETVEDGFEFLVGEAVGVATIVRIVGGHFCFFLTFLKRG